MDKIIPLEPSFSQSLGLTNNTLSLGSAITFIFVLLVMSALLVGGLRLAVAGFYKAEGTPASLAKFKDTLRRISVALIIILPISLLFSLLNKDFLVGDIGLDQFRKDMKAFAGGGGSGSGAGASGTFLSPPKASGDYPWPTGKVQGNGVTCNGGGMTRGFSKPQACMDNYKNIILEASGRYGVDKDIIRAVIYQESNGDPNVKSAVGAIGLMQIMPATASSIGCQNGWEYDPAKNIDCGTKYLKSSFSSFSSPYDVYAGYNGGYGPAAMGPSSYCSGLRRWQCAFESADFSSCNEGPVSYVESRNYAIMTDSWVREYKSGSCSW